MAQNFMKDVMKQSAKTLSKTDSNLLGLQHSALDVSPKLYAFTQWLNSPEFIQTHKTSNMDIHGLPAIKINHPIVFENYNRINGMGYGLKTLHSIAKGEVIIQQKTALGLISNTLSSDPSFNPNKPAQISQTTQESQDSQLTPAEVQEEFESQNLLDQLISLTQRVSQHFFPNPLQENQRIRLFQHLMLTQKLILLERQTESVTVEENYMSSYLDLLPREDMTQLLFWNKNVQLTKNDPNSPYLGQNSLSIEEFMWAFSTVSSRHLVFNNQAVSTDQNPFLMMLPLVDMINHSPSFQPNVVVLPYEDKLNSESYIIIQAIQDIQENEQLYQSYGNLSNTHLIQKYGFTLEQNPNNMIQHSFPFGSFERYTYEEQQLKRKLSQQFKIPINEQRFMGSFYSNRFNQDMFKTLRLGFLASQNIIDRRGTETFINDVGDMSKPFDPSNEQLCYEYLVSALDQSYQKLQPQEYYEQQIDNIKHTILTKPSPDTQEIQQNAVKDNKFKKLAPLDQYNLMNAFRLQADESRILKSNIEFLKKNKSEAIKKVLESLH
eukprot:403352531